MVSLQTIMLCKDLYGFQQLEATSTVETEGKWFLIYDKDQYDDVTDFIDNVLPDLYVQIDDKYKLEDYETPFRQMKRNTHTHCLYAEALKGLVENSNLQEDEDRKYNQPTERTRKCRTIAVVTEDFPDLTEKQKVIKMEEVVNNVKRATAAEMKKTTEEHNKKIAAVESSVTDPKTLVKQDIEQMKKELTEALKAEMTSMVKVATKEVMDDVRAEMRDYMKEEFKSMVAAVETQFTAMLKHIPSNNSKQHSNQEQQMSQGATGSTVAMHQQAPVTSEEISPPMYAHYPLTLFYSPY
eukprot:13530679-Ditylum_brightwellii.AAC.1